MTLDMKESHVSEQERLVCDMERRGLDEVREVLARYTPLRLVIFDILRDAFMKMSHLDFVDRMAADKLHRLILEMAEHKDIPEDAKSELAHKIMVISNDGLKALGKFKGGELI